MTHQTQGSHVVRAGRLVSVAGVVAMAFVTSPALGADGAPPLAIFAGTGTFGRGPDGVAATTSPLEEPGGLLERDGKILIYDCERVRQVDPATGIVTTIAGAGRFSFSGDGGPALAAGFAWNCNTSAVGGLAVDAMGRLLISDGVNNRIRMVDPSGTITTVAGTGAPAFSGDGGPATAAALYEPSAVAVDHRGNTYIADTVNHRVRRIDPAGTISTYVGGTTTSGCAVCPQATGVKATDAALWAPDGLAVDAQDNLYVSDSIDDRILTIAVDGTLTAVIGRPHAGTPGGFSGDGGPATNAELDSPLGLAVDRHGNLFIADTGNGRVREVDTTGTIRTVAGGGTATPFVGAQPTAAALPGPLAVLVDDADNLYISTQRVVLKAAAATPAPDITAAQALPLPAAKRCTSRRAFPIHVRRLRGVRWSSASVTLGGRVVPVYVYTDRRTRVKRIGGAALNDRRFRAYVDLRGRAQGTYTVHITATTTDGRMLTAARRYHTCRGARLRGSIPRL
jgi:sugar lactone lactonase YvrE